MSEEMNHNPEEVEETPDETNEIETTESEPSKDHSGKGSTSDDDDDDGEELVLEEEQETPQDDVRHDDFDWSRRSKHELPYTEQEIAKYLEEYESTLTAIGENEIVAGKVANISGGDVVLDLNSKSDGVVSMSEFRDTPDLKVGDTVEVYVEQQEDERGQLQLSRRKAKLLRTWESLVDSYNNGTIIKGQIISKTKGGLIVDAGGLETFLPGSQIDIKPIIDYDAYVGKTMEFKVVKINEAIKNAVVSHKALIESDLAEQREAIISGLEKGQVLEGVVKNLTDFGAFMDLGGVDGLLYITDISWGRINHPSDVLEMGQKINVVVLDFDENKKRISLGLKQLQPHPWDVLGDEIQEDSVVKGKIVNIEDYGAFLEITPGVEGLIHVSEISWSNQPINARDYFDIDQEFEAKVVTINRDDRKMSLSLKQLTKDPWSDIEKSFPDGSRHTGEVKNLTPYGVFVELEDGIGGMVHISDLSWTKRFSHPSEFTQIGENIDVVILEIDKENRKLSLGHKHIEENPWDTFESVFPVGSYHEATIVRKDEKGAIVQLPYGLEAFAPIKHIKKEDGKTADVEESLTFKVIEFNRDDKRILVSHQRYLDDVKRDATDEDRKGQTRERQDTERVVRSQQPRAEHATLGELDVFSQLKEQLAGDEGGPGKQKEEKEAQKEPAQEIEGGGDTSDGASDAEETKAQEPSTEPAEEKKDEPVEAAEEKPAAEKEEPVEVAEEKPAAEKKEPVEAAVGKPAAEKKAAKKKEGADDLRKIEGVGPKMAQILTDGGMGSFAAVASKKPDEIREVLVAAGSRYKMFDPETWPEQAALAAAGKWEELKALQAKLSGGRK